MRIGGLRLVALSIVLCLSVVGCSHQAKRGGKEGYGASTRGAGAGSGFGSEDERDLLAKRKIYFEFDRAEIVGENLAIIQAHANFLKGNTQRHVRVEGHTDEQGSRGYNVGLGERRARAVANALMADGVSAHQISTVSYGKEKPDVDGHTEDAYRLNRRAVIVYEER